MDMTQSALTRDGRCLSYTEYGSPEGDPVFLLHGMPGSRKGPRPRSLVLHLKNIRLIAYDRPGYALSSRQPGRTVADAASDVQFLADELGIERFAVVGRSGGAPHALACAALLPERVTRAAALAGLGPREAMGAQEWYRGMTRSNQVLFGAAERGHAAFVEEATTRIEQVRSDPDHHMPHEDPELPESDRAVIADYGIKVMLSENVIEGLRNSTNGWIDDVLAIVRPWGFDPARIVVPVLLWHGANDVFSPAGHARWLARRVRTSELRLVQGVSHFGAVEALPSVLQWLVESERPGAGTSGAGTSGAGASGGPSAASPSLSPNPRRGTDEESAA
jgi:pimeloyl-ACP methyl ester carboxylesterase